MVVPLGAFLLSGEIKHAFIIPLSLKAENHRTDDVQILVDFTNNREFSVYLVSNSSI